MAADTIFYTLLSFISRLIHDFLNYLKLNLTILFAWSIAGICALMLSLRMKMVRHIFNIFSSFSITIFSEHELIFDF